MTGRRDRRALALTALLALGPFTRGNAQCDSVARAAAVARTVLEADSSGDWPILLRLAHPDALREFRALQVFQLRMMGDTARHPVESLGVDADSAQYRRFAERRLRYRQVVLDSVFRVHDVDGLARLPPDSVFARWMRATRTGQPADSTPLPRSRARLVGVLPADDTLAYAVVVRSLPRLPGPVPEPFRDLPQPEETPEVMVLRCLDGEWRSMLEGMLLEEAGLAEDPLGGE